MIPDIFIFISCVFLSLSVVLGFKWRKEKNNLLKEILKSKQNISMGIMVISISTYLFIQVTSNGDGINFILILSLFMFLVGAINLVQGIRMHQHYVKQRTDLSK